MHAETPGAAGYEAEAPALITRYESLTFEHVHRGALALYPSLPCDVLDIGAGTGRDAAALARRGHRVVAVEPTRALREAGEHLHAGLDIEWVDDDLPSLQRLRARNTRFDLVLLTAVWMHLDLTERAAGIATLAALLAEGGQLVMTLRHGPVPPGRRMFAVSVDETIALAAGHGLACPLRFERESSMPGADVQWSVLALRRP